ncbi:hypothetical protein Micbo1qcDRAFT_205621 [Microdochium bolleyi]|uniref:Uncharacterized protein n=1 Tax=Microdochium bolleyi TaxID=196109 RepID=A0A136IZ05_9PEZI|nr:hypothetical protein Micbo1qcDRAFT_205621 [Microdochium bolleyi]
MNNHNHTRAVPTTATGWTRTAPSSSALSTASALSTSSAAAAQSATAQTGRFLGHAAADMVNYCRTSGTFAFAGAGGEQFADPVELFPGFDLATDQQEGGEFSWRRSEGTTGSRRDRPSLKSNGFRERTGLTRIWRGGERHMVLVLGAEDYDDSRSLVRGNGKKKGKEECACGRSRGQDEGVELDEFVGQPECPCSSPSTPASSNSSSLDRDSLDISRNELTTGQPTRESRASVREYNCSDGFEVVATTSPAGTAPAAARLTPDIPATAALTITISTSDDRAPAEAARATPPRQSFAITQQTHVLTRLEHQHRLQFLQYLQHLRQRCPSSSSPAGFHSQPRPLSQPQPQPQPAKGDEEEEEKLVPTSMLSYRSAMQQHEALRFAYEMQPFRYPHLGAWWEPPRGPVVERVARTVDVEWADGNGTDRVVGWFVKVSD